MSGPAILGGTEWPWSPQRFCVAKRKKGNKGKKERLSKQKLLKGCHQGQNVTVLAILERLEFKNFSGRPTMVADNTCQCSMAPHFEIHFAGPACLSLKGRIFRVPAQAQKANLRKLNLRDKIRQGLQILTGVLVEIVKTKKEKLTAYVAKKSMLSMGFFPIKQVKCVLMCEEFQTLCLDKVILNNGLTGLHETRGDPIEDNFPNRSLRYTTYKEFIWWVFKKLRKGNRRLIPLCALWKIRELYPEADENYVMYLEGKQD